VPARRDLTVEEIREQNRVRQARHRARHATSNGTHNVTRLIDGEARHVTPLQTSPVGGTTLSVEAGKGVAAILAPFEARGYRHDPRFWAKMAAKYPALDLELEALKLGDWLREPRNVKKRCSTPRIDNWLGIAEAKRLAPPVATPSNGPTTDVAHQPNSLKHNRQPDKPLLFTHDLKPVAPEEWRRELDQRRAVPFNEKLAAARNGRHA
jgi:hypothetical protein